jgi:outer membrane protein assembly factor BamB
MRNNLVWTILLLIFLSLNCGCNDIVPKIWSVELDATITAPLQTLESGRIVCGSVNGSLYQLDMSNGRLLGTRKVPFIFKFPFTKVNDKLYCLTQHYPSTIPSDSSVTSMYYGLTAFSAVDGRLLKSWPEIDGRDHDELSQIAPIAKGETIFFPSMNGALFAINTKTDEILWKYQSEMDEVSGSWFLLGNDIYFIDGDGKSIIQLNPVNGEAMDSLPLQFPSGMYRNAPVSTDSKSMAFIPRDSALVAFDAKTKRIRWVFKCDNLIASKPQIGQESIIISDVYSSIYCLNTKDGKLQWKRTRETRFVAQNDPRRSCFFPARQGEDIYIFEEDELRCLRIKDGSVSSRIVVGSGSQVAPLLVGDRLYYAVSNYVKCIDIQKVE